MANADVILDKLCQRVLTTRADVNERWPYLADQNTGQWRSSDPGNWCDGQWVEMLRMAGDLLGETRLIEEARIRTERIRWKLERDDMFRGHRFYYSAARLYEASGFQEMRTLALAAAYAVRSMAMHVNGAMPVGTQVDVEGASETLGASRHLVCCDNVHPNLMLDWWAWKETGDPVFLTGAERMLDVLVDYFIREDGSTIEFIDFDEKSGKPLRQFTLLGKSDDSCWSRGQAWAIAGFIIAYVHSRKAKHLETADRLFDYWWDRCASDAPPWDFDDQASTAQRDTSAMAIVMSALAKLSVSCDPSPMVEKLVGRLARMLDSISGYITPQFASDARPVGMLLSACFNYPRKIGVDCETLWGDFYLMEALYHLEKNRNESNPAQSRT